MRLGDNAMTPDWVLDRARIVLGGFALDPASREAANAHVKAHTWYGPEDHSLTRPWSCAYRESHGGIWLNPPYSRGKLRPFVDKLVSEQEHPRFPGALLLVNAGTSPKWFHCALSTCSAVLLFDRRISFLDPGTHEEVRGNAYDQALMLFAARHSWRKRRQQQAAFSREFGSVGTILTVKR